MGMLLGNEGGGLKLGRRKEGLHCCCLHGVCGAWMGLEDAAVTNSLLRLPHAASHPQPTGDTGEIQRCPQTQSWGLLPAALWVHGPQDPQISLGTPKPIAAL